MHALLFTIFAVLTVGLLVLSVALHELGHLTTAKRYGMLATRYFIGFGPTLFSFRRGETEYGVKAIPAGGFVKIVGMSPLESGTGQSAAEAEQAAAEVASLPTDLLPDERRLFYTYPAGQRTVVLGAGSFMHGVLALILTFTALAVGGDLLGKVRVLPVIAQVIPCATPAADDTCAPGAPPSAAARAGLRVGDRVVAVGGHALGTYDELTAYVRGSADRSLTLTIIRSRRALTVVVTPTLGHPVGPDGRPSGVAEGFLGVSPVIVQAPLSVLGAARRTFPTLGTTLGRTGAILGHLPSEVVTIIEGKPRSATTSAVSVYGVVRATGDIGASSLSSRDKISNLLFIGGELNLFVGIVNLLPLLPLDGGHIAIIAFEKARAGLARRRGRRDPGRVNILHVLPAAYAAFALIMGLTFLLVYADIVNPVQGT